MQEARNVAFFQIALHQVQIQSQFVSHGVVGCLGRTEPALHVLQALQDGGQRIVDLVRHAGRQLPQGLQLFVLQHHGVELLAQRDVIDTDDGAGQFQRVQRIDRDVQIACAVLVFKFHVLAHARLALRNGLVNHVGRYRQVWIDFLQAEAQRLFLADAGGQFGGRIPVRDMAAWRHADHDRRHRVDDAVQVFLGFIKQGSGDAMPLLGLFQGVAGMTPGVGARGQALLQQSHGLLHGVQRALLLATLPPEQGDRQYEQQAEGQENVQQHAGPLPQDENKRGWSASPLHRMGGPLSDCPAPGRNAWPWPPATSLRGLHRRYGCSGPANPSAR